MIFMKNNSRPFENLPAGSKARAMKIKGWMLKSMLKTGPSRPASWKHYALGGATSVAVLLAFAAAIAYWTGAWMF
jgi:hypothetical protein